MQQNQRTKSFKKRSWLGELIFALLFLGVGSRGELVVWKVLSVFKIAQECGIAH
jgi:hypothetical protein